MAVLSLPLSFTNSFWSQDYWRGLEVLFGKLEQGVAENDEIIAFIRARTLAESQLAASLTTPMLTGAPGTGFGADDGASLLMAFRGLQAESVTQGQAHNAIAKELETLVADPFDKWAQGHKERLKHCKNTVIDNWLRSYQHAQGEVLKMKHDYLAKTRRADEIEDDAKFAPNNELVDKYTSSPRLRPHDARTPQRSATVSERITQRLKEIQRKGAGVLAATTEEDKSDTGTLVDEKESSKVDKGKAKALDEQTTHVESPPPMSPLLPPAATELVSPSSPMPPIAPPPMLLAGVALPRSAVSHLLIRAASELPLRSVRFSLIGEYQDCFTGEEFVAWLNENVHAFGGSLDRAEDAARELTERDGLLRRIGEFGNLFEHSDDAFYQFRSKAFDLEGKGNQHNSTAAPTNKGHLAPVATKENILKRTGTLVNFVSKALNANTTSEPTYIRARQDAEDADKVYRVAVRKLDRQRLGLEERLEDTLKNLQRWEVERLRAVKTVLLQYQGTLANLPKAFEPSIERSGTLIAAYQPESDLTALIERYRTGPFRPTPQVYESVVHDEPDVVFGIDLRKWAEGGWNAVTVGEEKKDLIPPVLTTMLAGLNEAYEKLPNDVEKRKSWIYEVPLPAVHHLREALNGVPPDHPIPTELLSTYDAPVIAGAVKLWALELDPPLSLYEGWDEFRKIYPTVGQKTSEDTEQQRIQDLSTVLQRLPRVHLYVLDAIVKHLKTLVDSTTTEESNDVYITKLALSVGRTIIRPRHETEISVQDRHPTLLFIDLVKNYDAILPPTITRKKRESERKLPIRKRTAPVDMRLSRSRISVGADVKQLLAAQQAAQNPSLVKSKSPETVPIQPPAVAAPIVDLTPPPPPPPVHSQTDQPKQLTPPPPPPVSPKPVSDVNAPPARPSFKEPPPEVDDLPPRPSFKEPPPEADEASPPVPKFADPVEDTEVPSIEPKVTPPTPQKALKRQSVSSRTSSPSPSKIASRSPSPGSEDQSLGSGKTNISRVSSGQTTHLRGPRISRGPRAPAGSNVGSMISNLNRNSMSGSPPAPGSSPVATRRLSNPPGRPSSVLGRTSAFSRRTMASDAEDDVVDRR